MLHLLDFFWSVREQIYTQKISVRDFASGEIKDWDLFNYEFKFSLSKEKYCIGFQKDGKLHKCVNSDKETGLGKLLTSQNSQCNTCENIEGFKSAFFMQQIPNANIQEYLKRDHFIYLAYFEPGIIKVGTAVSERQAVRLVEQDALIYILIGKAKGSDVQKYESEISRKLNITQIIKSSHKINYLNIRPKLENVQKLLMSKFDSLTSEKESELTKILFDRKDIKVIDLTISNTLFFPTEKPKLFKVKDFSEYDFVPVYGRFMGLRGRYLIIQNRENNYAFDINELVGRVIEIGENFDYTRLKGEQIQLI